MKPKKKVQLLFYTLPGGNQPVRDWIISLAPEDRLDIGKGLQYIEYSWPVGMPRCRAMGDGLWEMRSAISGKRAARVLFGIARGEMVLLHAFIKKTQETPHKELEIALTRWKYLEDKRS
jgi:phage-related protein